MSYNWDQLAQEAGYKDEKELILLCAHKRPSWIQSKIFCSPYPSVTTICAWQKKHGIMFRGKRGGPNFKGWKAVAAIRDKEELRNLDAAEVAERYNTTLSYVYNLRSRGLITFRNIKRSVGQRSS